MKIGAIYLSEKQAKKCDKKCDKICSFSKTLFLSMPDEHYITQKWAKKGKKCDIL